jgi:hypothetical protein
MEPSRPSNSTVWNVGRVVSSWVWVFMLYLERFHCEKPLGASIHCPPYIVIDMYKEILEDSSERGSKRPEMSKQKRRCGQGTDLELKTEAASLGI